MTNEEPNPADRVYYRSRADGQRAYVVTKDGVDVLRLDRPMESIYHAIDGTWTPDVQTYPASKHQVARIAFLADRALCGVMGLHVEAKQDWLNLKEQKRIDWMNEGPCTGDVRDDLYDAIMGTLKSMTDGS